MAENIVDDKGTSQAEARNMLANLCQKGFDNNVGELAIVLGRPSAEISGILENDEMIDDDLAMKIRGIAGQRQIEIE
jgi:plasmid maintenance system antidote protein VapI